MNVCAEENLKNYSKKEKEAVVGYAYASSQ